MADELLHIDVPSRERVTQTVRLGDDRVMTFRLPKITPIPAALRGLEGIPDADATDFIVTVQNRWLRAGFDADDWAHIQSRLNSDDDMLHQHHLSELFGRLFSLAVELAATR